MLNLVRTVGAGHVNYQPNNGTVSAGHVNHQPSTGTVGACHVNYQPNNGTVRAGHVNTKHRNSELCHNISIFVIISSFKLVTFKAVQTSIFLLHVRRTAF